MILPVKFSWEQLDGPQVTALNQAIFQYWKEMLDPVLEYLNNISIETANDAHLTLLGIIGNFIRPTIQVIDKDYFLFTEHAEHDNAKGFSSLDNRKVGSRLTDIKGATYGPQALDTEYYRTLLKTYRDSDADIASLVLLDEICNALFLKNNPTGTPSYTFEFIEDTSQAGRGPGDVYINMGGMDDWSSPLQVYAVLNGLANSVFWPLPRIWTSLDTDVRAHTPVASPAGGIYGEPTTITLSSATDGATIIYTLDGSEPIVEQGTLYTEPFTITDTVQLRAKAYKVGLEPSYEYSAQYVISTDIQLPTPLSTVASGLYTGDQTITLYSNYGLEVVIRYTTDGTDPDENSTVYTEPITTSGNTLIKARAYRGTSYIPSEVLTVNARIMPAPVSILPEVWTRIPLIELSCTTDDVTILYSIDGSAPSIEYTEPFYLYEDATVRAMATKTGYTDSIITEKEYDITQVPDVTASLPSGTYTIPQSVELSCLMPGVTIYYTIDGSEPDEASTIFNEGDVITFTTEGTHVIKAKAYKGELIPSDTATWTYVMESTVANLVAIAYEDGEYVVKTGTADKPSESTTLELSTVESNLSEVLTSTAEGHILSKVGGYYYLRGSPLVRSNDLQTWEVVSTSFNIGWAVEDEDSQLAQFIWLDSTNDILYTQDVASGTIYSAACSVNTECIRYADGYYYITSTDNGVPHLWKTTDITTEGWTEITIPISTSSATHLSIGSAGALIMTDSDLCYSTDMDTWTAIPAFSEDFSRYSLGCCYNPSTGKYYVTVLEVSGSSNNYYSYTSSDLITWEKLGEALPPGYGIGAGELTYSTKWGTFYGYAGISAQWKVTDDFVSPEIGILGSSVRSLYVE